MASVTPRGREEDTDLDGCGFAAVDDVNGDGANIIEGLDRSAKDGGERSGPSAGEGGARARPVTIGVGQRYLRQAREEARGDVQAILGSVRAPPLPFFASSGGGGTTSGGDCDKDGDDIVPAAGTNSQEISESATAAVAVQRKQPSSFPLSSTWLVPTHPSSLPSINHQVVARLYLPRFQLGSACSKGNRDEIQEFYDREGGYVQRGGGEGGAKLGCAGADDNSSSSAFGKSDDGAGPLMAILLTLSRLAERRSDLGQAL